MLCCSKQPVNSDLFQIPFGPISYWNEIVALYPTIIDEMDGKSEENTLLFYYEFNRVNGTYKFKDEDSENDFAEILGMDFHTISTGESKEDEETRKLDADEENERVASLAEFMNPSKKTDERKSKINLSKEEIIKLKEANISIPEYICLMNPDSISSDISMDDFIVEKQTNSKKAKKERRRLLVESRNKIN